MKKTSRSGEQLTGDEVAFVSTRAATGLPSCPDCLQGELVTGPCAGVSVNVECNDLGCGSRFNVVAPSMVERTSDASPRKPKVPLDRMERG